MHGMKKESFAQIFQAKRHLRTDEMHLMPAGSQPLSQFRRNDAAAADARKTSDADTHAILPSVSRILDAV